MRTPQQHDEKKREIMEKCFDCYAENGLSGTGIKALGKTCGQSLPPPKGGGCCVKPAGGGFKKRCSRWDGDKFSIFPDGKVCSYAL